ncbi:MAG: hypothetical protein IJE89_05930 [Bacilli bacterium]|nr:hypothetical protein [Bacilli bacterium]
MLLLKMSFWEKAIRGLMAMICQLLYPLIGWLYDLFINISKLNILSSEEVRPIYQRVTLILTIVMVFYVTFEFVKFVVQPEGITDKEKGVGNIVYKMILVVVLIAFVPTIFTAAFDLQNAIVKQGIIGKIIIGNTETDPSKFGKTFSANVFGMFYSVDEEYKEKDCDGIKCGTLVSMNTGSLANYGELTYLTKGLEEVIPTDTQVDGETAEMPLINFNGFLAVIVGGFIAYILAMYCIDVGVRWAQLVFLQIVAPIPIIGYLSPKKDGIFQKWTKQCFTTYLDLFIRIAIIYFILLICSMLLEARANPLNGGFLSDIGVDPSSTMGIFMYIVLVLGVMMFAKKAPELLKELFPKMGAASGNFGLKASDRGVGLKDLQKAGRVFGRVAGAVGGAAIGAGAGLATGIGQGLRKRHSAQTKGGKALAGTLGATWGALRGVVGGATRGIYQGSKKGNMLKNIGTGYKNQVESNKKYGNRAENGYGLGDQIGDKLKSSFGARSRVEVLEDSKAPIKRQQDVYEKVRKANNDMTAEAESQVKKGKGRYSGELAAAEKRLQNLNESQTLREDTKTTIKTSQEYTEAVSKISKIDENGKAKTAEQIRAEAESILETMTDTKIASQLAAAQKAVKSAKDKAVFDFITNGEWNGTEYSGQNAKIQSIRSVLDTEITEYNKNNAHHQVDETTIRAAMKDGELFDALIKGQRKERKDENGNTIVIDYTESGINNKIDENQNKLTTITQKQDAIKRETEGSGINEGKK